MNQRKSLISIIVLIWSSFMQAMVFDNRYFPLIQEPYITIDDRPSHLRFDPFVTTATKAFGGPNGSHIGIPEIFGPFNLSFLGRAFLLAGLPTPLTPNEITGFLPYSMQGKIQTQGLQFSYYHNIRKRIGVGFYLMAMESNSSINFFFDTSNTTLKLSQSDIAALDQDLRQMISTLGESCNHVRQAGFGDMEFFAQWGDHWDYLYKFRSIESWFRLGLLVPTGQRKNINQPASVPFGGDGFWGIYGAVFGEFEIREDWKLGVYLRASKRFRQERTARMPIGFTNLANPNQGPEQPLFGVLVDKARINPGWTGVFSPYFEMENLREGLGFRAQYTLIAHQKDHWCRGIASSPLIPNLKAIEDVSGWSSEYITLTGFYDFGKMKIERYHEPIILLSWYIPVSLLKANRSVRSFKVSLGVEYSF